MSTTGNTEQPAARSLAQLPISLFIILCVGLSIGGVILCAIVGSDSIPGLLLYAGIPPLVVIWIRLRSKRKAAAAKSDIGRAETRTPPPTTSEAHQRPYVGEYWPTARPRLRSPKQLLIVAGVLIAAIVVIGVVLSNNGPRLKVETRGGLLSIQNIGSEPITIRHLSVNDRSDCGMQRSPIDLILGPVAPPGEAPTLKVGDVADWNVYCPIVRLTVETDRGTAAYTFD
jgi:hypothetical protein